MRMKLFKVTMTLFEIAWGGSSDVSWRTVIDLDMCIFTTVNL